MEREKGIDIIDSFPDGAGYFTEPGFYTAIIGQTDDGRLIYDFEKMVESAMESQGWTEEETLDWISVNTLRTIPYMGAQAPIILYKL